MIKILLVMMVLFSALTKADGDSFDSFDDNINEQIRLESEENERIRLESEENERIRLESEENERIRLAQQNVNSTSDSSSNESSTTDSSSNESSTTDSRSNESSRSDSDTVDNNIITQIHHISASCARDVKKPSFFRETTPEYFSTYLGNIINQQSLKEFFNLTNNNYKSTCNDWYRKYVNKQFHKALIFAYDKNNIKGVSSYWGFSYNALSRKMAEQNALQACEASSEKIESHICTVLFSNNEIANKDYLALAKTRNN
jgi:hypothetical protein